VDYWKKAMPLLKYKRTRLNGLFGEDLMILYGYKVYCKKHFHIK
jgi:hypothetical protein